jgi:hypothetical protein
MAGGAIRTLGFDARAAFRQNLMRLPELEFDGDPERSFGRCGGWRSLSPTLTH